MTQELTLFDIPTAKGAETWSPDVWRVRMVLNYKRLPYKTEWVDMPDIGNVGQRIGAKTTIQKPGSKTQEMLWTCPMLIDPNHPNALGKSVVLSGSQVIVEYLEDAYPERKVIPEGTAALHAAWSDFITQNIEEKIWTLVVTLCPNILSERGKQYFVTTRETWWGPLVELCPDREKAWAGVKEGLDKVAAALDSNGEDDGANLRVVPGRETYADFVMLSLLLWAGAIVQRDEWDTLRSWNGGRWGRILDFHTDVVKIQ
ncbi:Glutathione S-transferase-like protein ustS [Hypsizygus marmoreus]|uniref:Glutathione S-transferase-like protein ustS n=1 Tax=Hypsizygus marmoreus TaxID=39966 RepID=A0A369J8M1_HYPMA|nr:Glutathione S-transferase-like protein ustS [Hypsizygus marmoreus]